MMQAKSRIVNLSLSFIFFVGALCLVEFVCYKINLSNGVKLPYFLNTIPPKEKRLVDGNDYKSLDALLGYTYSKGEADKINLSIGSFFKDGFVFYNTGMTVESFNKRKLQRPVIVTLGGSTTEPFFWETSWPEELAKMMARKGILGTVINGGVGGYTSNQELLKIQRDVLELEPDIVIAYHGVNEQKWAPYPYPMTGEYMNNILQVVVSPNTKMTFLPNTRYFFANLKPKTNQVSEVFRGVATDKSPAQYFVRNMRLMKAILRECNTEYYSILQPYCDTGKYGESLSKLRGAAERGERGERGDVIRKKDLEELYDELKKMPQGGKADFEDFTTIFDELDGSDNIYLDDVHVNARGNKIIAGKMLKLLEKSPRFKAFLSN